MNYPKPDPFPKPKPDPKPFCPCFIGGKSFVVTNKGYVLIDDLKLGDKVLTRDNGYKEVTWLGHANAFGYYQYDNAFFSPQHRILIPTPGNEYFCATKKLKNTKYIEKPVIYYHFLLDKHEVVLSGGVWSESFYPGPYVMGTMDPETYQEIYSLFPEFSKWELAREEKK